jgi:hypothetical protein
MNVVPWRGRGCPDLRFIHIRTLGRPGADPDRNHRTEADQAGNNEPDDASHDASRRYRTGIMSHKNPFNKSDQQG